MLRATATILLVVALAGCGSSSSPGTTSTAVATTTVVTTTTAARTTTAAAPNAPGALQVEAAQTAAGDIPDNQVFVSYPGKAFTMKFPEGWVQTSNGDAVTFRDKNNIVRVVVQPGAVPTIGSVRHELAALKGVTVSPTISALTIGGRRAVKATYTTASAPNPVTGKRVTLTVDRYVLAKGAEQAVVDLGSPVGVDNVDAYRLMIQSFRLR